ncbi:hypothetical protein D3C72_1421640 [compost metagenome]
MQFTCNSTGRKLLLQLNCIYTFALRLRPAPASHTPIRESYAPSCIRSRHAVHCPARLRGGRRHPANHQSPRRQAFQHRQRRAGRKYTSAEQDPGRHARACIGRAKQRLRPECRRPRDSQPQWQPGANSRGWPVHPRHECAQRRHQHPVRPAVCAQRERQQIVRQRTFRRQCDRRQRGRRFRPHFQED